jgi:citrate lyase synthetase
MKPEDSPSIDPRILENPVFKRVMADALAIQHRFAAEPVYARTGRGYLKSEGVEELQRLKEETAGRAR